MLPLDAGGTLGDHVARLAVAIAGVLQTLAREVRGVFLEVAPSAGTARGPQQGRGNADADDQRGNRSWIFTRRVVSGVVSASIAAPGSLSHLHASYG